jgi:hypothetical protein
MIGVVGTEAERSPTLINMATAEVKGSSSTHGKGLDDYEVDK